MTTTPAEQFAPSAPPALLSAAGVRRSFRMGDAELSVLRQVDFDLRPGEFVAIEGRSGSGKSTLLHVLAALDSVDGGTLSFEGRPYTRSTPPPPSRWRVRLLGGRGEAARSWWVRVCCYAAGGVAGLVLVGLGWTAVMHFTNGLLKLQWATPTSRQTSLAQTGVGLLLTVVLLLALRWVADVWSFGVRLLGERPTAVLRNKKFGFVFQSYHLLPEMNVVENVMLAPEIEFSAVDFHHNAAAFRRRAEDLLTQLGMGHRITHRTSQLSGGERQRVAIARALMNRPAVLFADEPTGNLDVETGRQIMDLLEGLHRDHGQTIVMVTHDRSLAREADRVLVLKDGRLEPAA